MHILYGTPLPPGLVAPTKGELRLRVEQLILDDDAINHNPLVQLFDASETGSSARGAPGAEPNGAAARSPNRFDVPIDHCAVGPIFWGETRPSAHGQPATPQLRRGPVIMAYPIKMHAEQFGAYLERMTASPQRGVQVDVFVPSSYSGRPPVTVGRCRVALDQLYPGHAVHGWFPVVHRRSRLSSEDAGPYRLAEVPIGKLKLTASVDFYPTTQRSSSEPPATPAAALEKKHKRHLEGKDGGRAPLPQAKTRRSHRHPGRTDEDAAHPPTETSSSSTAARSASSPTTPTHTDAEKVQLRGAHRLRGAARGTDLVRDRTTSTQQLLKLGLRLRAQMQAAARGLAFEGDSDAPDGASDEATHAAHATSGARFADGGEDGIVHDEDDDDGSDATYTSEDSDGEKFALQMQRDSEARDQRRPAPPRASPSSTSTRPLLVESSALRQSQLLSTDRPLLSDSAVGAASAAGLRADIESSETRGRCATVELAFSNFSFAQTPLTADLQKMRINVRLSSDIATLEPSAGPLSSFVHPVPVLQPSICLLFDVCSFTEERSKLVVEAYKVVNEVEVETEEGGWGAQGPRQVAKEELLGLSVVGLYRQSRAVVFRDPVLDTTNVFAELDVRVGPHGAETGTVSAVSPSAASHTPHGRHPQVTLSGEARVEVSSNADAAAVRQRGGSKTAATQVDARSGVAAEQHAESSSIGYPLRIAQVPEAETARCRLRVVVHSAAELPRVAVAEASRRHAAGGSFPIVSARPRSLPEAGVNGATSYAEPNSFVTIEDVYRVAVEVCEAESPLAAPSASLRATQREAVHGWYVDEARGGFFDRSAVAEASSSPEYGYAATLQLPELQLPVKTARSSSGSGPRGVANVLEELQLGVWHSDLSRRSASVNGSATTAAAATAASTSAGQRGGGGGRGRRQEEAFWAAAAYMGTCRVDLRPLRYLKLLDGYYRVVCERAPGSVLGPSAAEAEASTIGYVRLSVSLM